MDYYLSDRHFLPPGQFDKYFTEKLVYLPANVPFQASEAAPPVNALLALASGRMTFASFNRVVKINATTIDLWANLLRAVPTAELLIGGIPGNFPLDRLFEHFAAGVARERIAFHPRCGMEAYLALHNHVDVCLDTYPYNGGTTTVHAIWMGIPTITWSGRRRRGVRAPRCSGSWIWMASSRPAPRTLWAKADTGPRTSGPWRRCARNCEVVGDYRRRAILMSSSPAWSRPCGACGSVGARVSRRNRFRFLSAALAQQEDTGAQIRVLLS